MYSIPYIPENEEKPYNNQHGSLLSCKNDSQAYKTVHGQIQHDRFHLSKLPIPQLDSVTIIQKPDNHVKYHKVTPSLLL